MKMIRHPLVVFFFIFTALSSASHAVVYYDDPISVGIGARPLGMGKAFVAVADDSNAIFLNPAGLGSQTTNWVISTMTSNFLDEYQYTMFCGVTPLPIGVFGIGYVSSKISGVTVSSEGFSGTSDFYNEAVVLSFGKDVGQILSFTGDTAKVYAGATVKFYSKGFTGNIRASGTGYNVDFGLKYVPAEWLSYGLNFQNMIYGSKIYGFDPPEEMPSVTKVGLALRWLEYNATLSLDQDVFLNGSNTPWPLHVGAEWVLHPNLSLRTGYDQETSGAAGGTLTNNTTFGIGFNYGGIYGDLAYMQNYAQTDLSSSIFSLTFVSTPYYGQEAPPPKKEEIAPAVKAPAPPATAETIAPPAAARGKTVAEKVSIVPARNLYTMNEGQYFTGSADLDVTNVWIGGKKVEIGADRGMNAFVPLSIGMNEKTITVADSSGARSEITRKIIRFYVPTGLSAEEAENKPFEYKVLYTELRRYLGKDFNTGKYLTRETLALILSKAKKLAPPQPQRSAFKDVNRSSPAAQFISAVAAAGIMQGYPDGTFKPANIVTKAEAANIISKASGMDKAWLKEYLASGRSREKAALGDLVEIASHSTVFKEAINRYRDFLYVNI